MLQILLCLFPLIIGLRGYAVDPYSSLACKVPQDLRILGYDHSKVTGSKTFKQGFVSFGGIIVVDCGTGTKNVGYGQVEKLGDGLKSFKCNPTTQASFGSLTCDSKGSSCDLKDIILFYSEHVSVHNAERSCEAKGGFLASIKSWYENSVAVWLMKHCQATGGFIGLTDKRHEGYFEWMDGSEFDISSDFSNWFYSYADSQPNDSGYLNVGEDYVIIDLKESNGQWYDVGPPRRSNPLVPGDILGYFCKIPKLKLTGEPGEPDVSACEWSEWSAFTRCHPGAEYRRSTRRCDCPDGYNSGNKPQPRNALGSPQQTPLCDTGSSFKEEKCDIPNYATEPDKYGATEPDKYGATEPAKYGGTEERGNYGNTVVCEWAEWSEYDACTQYKTERVSKRQCICPNNYQGTGGSQPRSGLAAVESPCPGQSFRTSTCEEEEVTDGYGTAVCEWAEWSGYDACSQYKKEKVSRRRCICPGHQAQGGSQPRSGLAAVESPCPGQSYRSSPCGGETVLYDSPPPKNCNWDEFKPVTECYYNQILYYRACECNDLDEGHTCEGAQTEFRPC